MKNVFTFPLIIGLSFTLYASQSMAAASTRSAEFPLSSSLSIEGNYQINIQQDASAKKTQITLKGDEQDIKDLVVEGGKDNIKISSPKKLNSAVMIEVHAYNLNQLTLQGNNKLSMSPIETSSFKMEIQGSNDVNLSKIKTSDFQVKIKGNTMLMLAGTTDTLNADLFGNSKLDALNLAANKVILTSKGSSDVSINVKDALERHLEGRVSLTIKGTPKVTGETSGMLELKEVK